MTHYQTLGVEETASVDELKSAWKKKAKEHHPDKHKGDDTQMKLVNQAYDELKDPQKRQEYDDFRKFGNRGGRNPFAQGRQGFGGFGIDIDEIFNRGFGRRRSNSDIGIRMQITLEEAFEGKTTVIRIPIDNEQKEIEIDIPAGIPNGVRIKYDNAGSHAIKELSPGNLIVTIEIQPHPVFHLRNFDLLKTIEVQAFDSILGTERIIETINNKKLNLKIPEGTVPGASLKLKGHGMPMPGTNRRGDLLITVNIIMPKLNAEQKVKLKELINE